MSKPENSPINSICVYCGSSSGTNTAYLKAAEELGRALAKNKIRLIYGGGDTGLMGAVARAVLKGGGEVTGIIPQFLQQLEQHRESSLNDEAEMIVVSNMHERKQIMFERADAFIALPGGIGTLEELVEMLTWAQLKRHDKPVAVLNVEGFWTPFSNLLIQMEEAGFLHNAKAAQPLVFDDATQAVETLLLQNA